MNDFHTDNDWQRGVRDTILVPGFYDKLAKDGRYVLIDKGRLAPILQKHFAIDTIVQAHDGRAICIEEKIVRWPGYCYADFCLETHSCTVAGHESPGWMFYGEADYLLYCFQLEAGDLDCWLIDFQRLQAWFWSREQTFPVFEMRTNNRSRGRKVPVKDVHRAVPTHRRLVKVQQDSPPLSPPHQPYGDLFSHQEDHNADL